MQSKGYYSLVRFVPDAFRGEGVNLGVILLCPGRKFLEWKLTDKYRRARSFFRYDIDAARLRTLGRGLVDRLEQSRREFVDPERLRDFVGRHQDMLQLTALRTCTVGDPAAELNRLFARLVDDETARARLRASDPQQVLRFTKSAFEKAGILDRLDQDVPFQGRYRTSPYHFSFGYQNGGPYKLIHTTSFVFQNPDDAFNRAFVVLGQIDDVREHPPPGRELDFEVVGALETVADDARKAIQAAFQDKKVELWEPESIAPLIQRVADELR